MIDRASRTSASELLRHLVAGQITNDVFEKRFPRSSDLAVREMWAAGWMLYDDYRSYRLVGSDRLRPEDRTTIARCVLFLQTELPYEWPRASGLVPFVGLVLNLLTLGYGSSPLAAERQVVRQLRQGQHQCNESSGFVRQFSPRFWR